eukprot:12403851-Karenia_brevis.AAC.1
MASAQGADSVALTATKVLASTKLDIFWRLLSIPPSTGSRPQDEGKAARTQDETDELPQLIKSHYKVCDSVARWTSTLFHNHAAVLLLLLESAPKSP